MPTLWEGYNHLYSTHKEVTQRTGMPCHKMTWRMRARAGFHPQPVWLTSGASPPCCLMFIYISTLLLPPPAVRSSLTVTVCNLSLYLHCVCHTVSRVSNNIFFFKKRRKREGGKEEREGGRKTKGPRFCLALSKHLINVYEWILRFDRSPWSYPLRQSSDLIGRTHFISLLQASLWTEQEWWGPS